MSQSNIVNMADESIIKIAINENIESLNRIDEFFNGQGVHMDDESIELLYFLLERFKVNMKQKAKEVNHGPTSEKMIRQAAQAANIAHKIKAIWIDSKRKSENSER